MGKKQKSKQKKKHGFFWKLLKGLFILILIILLAIGGFVGYSTLKNGWGIKGLIQTAVGSTKQLEELEEFQVLILGISEDIEAKLTDTIMVASYNPKTQKAVLLSIPRDTFVGVNKSRASSYDKINAIYQMSGAEGVIEKVNNLTGLDLEKYIVISNNALIELVDEIGGVEFDVPTDMDYDSKRQNLHIHLKAGLQTLNGDQAEGLVRFRKNNNGTSYSYEYGSDDYGRMKTQREFIKAVVRQTVKAKNITKIGALIDIVKKNVETNISDWEEIKEYIPYVVEFDIANVQTANIPGVSARIPEGTGLWFFLANDLETKEKIKEMFTVQNSTEDAETVEINSKIKIEILDGSGVDGNLKKVESLLKEKGYDVSKTEKTTKTVKTAIINKTEVEEGNISNIRELLGIGVVSKSKSKTSKVDVTIIIGEDFK